MSNLDFDPTLKRRIWGSRGGKGRRCSMTLILAACLVIFAVSVWFAVQAFERQRETIDQEALLQTSLQHLSGQDSLQSAIPHGVELSNEERKALNRVVQRLNTPWPEVFETVERHTPSDIAILRIEPDETGVLTIEAEALSIDKVLAFAGQLSHQGAFGNLALQHHDTNDQDPNQPVRLSFQLHLNEGK